MTTLGENEHFDVRTPPSAALGQPPGVVRTPRPAQEIAEYKKRSLAAGYWGAIPSSDQPLQPRSTAEAQDTFIRGLLDTPTDRPRRSAGEWLVSLAAHVVILGALVIAPLVFTQNLNLRHLQLTYLAVPRPPAAPAPPPPVSAVKRLVRSLELKPTSLVAPAVVPPKIAVVKDDPAPEINPDGVTGGLPGGDAGGVFGGGLEGTLRPSAPAAPVATASAKRAVYRVGGNLKPPRGISSVEPTYPLIARRAHVEGVVIVDAVIDEHGNVTEARAVSGPGLLMAAAVQAVLQWKYEPTYLNGTPVPLELEVSVSFSLH